LQLNQKNVRDFVSSVALPPSHILLACWAAGAGACQRYCWNWLVGCAVQVDADTPGIVTVVDLDSSGTQASSCPTACARTPFAERFAISVEELTEC